MKKLFKKLKNRKGMTLTELLVGIAVFSILMLTVTTVFMQMVRLQQRAVAMSELNTLVDNVANPIISDLLGSTHVCNVACPVAIPPCNNFDPDIIHMTVSRMSVRYRISTGCATTCICCNGSCGFVPCDSSCGVNPCDFSCGAVPCNGACGATGFHPPAGILLRNGRAVLADDFYKGRNVALAFGIICEAEGASCVCIDSNRHEVAYSLTVTITDAQTGADITSRTYSVRPLMLNPY
jgi:prepilin-type N-terminal cleavage/methylation domain-containing protein